MPITASFVASSIASTNEFESTGTTYLIGTTILSGSMYVSGGSIYGTSSWSSDIVAKGYPGYIQYNNGGILAGDTSFIFDPSTNRLFVASDLC